MNKLLSAILRGPWLIDPAWVQLNMPMIKGILEGKEYSSNNDSVVNNRSVPHIVDFTKGEICSAYDKEDGSVSFNKANPGSVAIIPVTGPIIKYDGACGEVGSMTRASWVQKADMSDNISAILIVLDTPGGQVSGTQTLADSIKNCSKPTVGFIEDGYCCSAGYWFGSSCTELYASHKTDRIGSIGVYTTFMDIMAYYEKLGLKVHEIYAPESSEKNLDYKEALKGNYEKVEEDLSYLAKQFISSVKSNRKGKLNISENQDPFKGEVYFADKAVEIGLIDGIKTIEQAILRAEELSNKQDNSKKKSNNNTRSDMNIFGKKNKAIETLKGKKAEEISKEELQAANAELQESGVEAAVLITTATQESIETVAGQLTTAQQTIDATAAAIKEAGFESLEALISSHNEWQEKAIKYGAEPAADRSAPTKEGSSEIDNAEKKELNSWEVKAAKKSEY